MVFWSTSVYRYLSKQAFMVEKYSVYRYLSKQAFMVEKYSKLLVKNAQILY